MRIVPAISRTVAAELQAAVRQGQIGMFLRQSLRKGLQAVVAADSLNAVARKNHGIAIGHILSVRPAHYGGNHHAVAMADIQFAKKID